MKHYRARDVAVIVLGGIAFYYLHVNLVGIAAAIAAPDWFVPFMHQNQTIGLILFALVTTVPATALAAGIIGFVLSRIVDARYFVIGLLAVCAAVLFGAFTVDYGFGFLGDLRRTVLPSHWIDVPMILALWLFLPLTMLFFGSRKEQELD